MMKYFRFILRELDFMGLEYLVVTDICCAGEGSCLNCVPLGEHWNVRESN